MKITGTMLSLSLGLLALACRADVARISALVLDAESRKPIAGVKMKARFDQVNGWGAAKGSPDPVWVEVRTDRKGRCQAEGTTNAGSVEWVMEEAPKGYSTPAFIPMEPFTGKDAAGVWQPDNRVTTVLLQRKGKGSPLVLKALTRDFASTPARVDHFTPGNGRAAYDLLRGDWLPPAGHGEVADVEFTRGPEENLGEGKGFNGRPVRLWRVTAMMRFPGEGNGIVERKTFWDRCPRIREAPEKGYQPELVFEKRFEGWNKMVDRHYMGKDFCFRIRTRRDAEGRLVGGLYGKINGGVWIVDSRVDGVYNAMGEVVMRYALNPVNLDRNLVWDEANLLEWDAQAGRLKSIDVKDRPWELANRMLQGFETYIPNVP